MNEPLPMVDAERVVVHWTPIVILNETTVIRLDYPGIKVIKQP